MGGFGGLDYFKSLVTFVKFISTPITTSPTTMTP